MTTSRLEDDEPEGETDAANLVARIQESLAEQKGFSLSPSVERLEAVAEEISSLIPLATLIISKLIIPEKHVDDGVLLLSTAIEWDEILKHLDKDWDNAFKIPPDKWEEIVAGAYKRAGFDEVILTRRSNDKGRDVIAIKKGVGTVKILGSVKAYGPGKVVRHDDVRALVGVLSMEPNASKGVLTTTSDFAPMVMKDTRYTNLMPTRLELVNGKQLQEWLRVLSKKT